jgi:hypothetical protein
LVHINSNKEQVSFVLETLSPVLCVAGNANVLNRTYLTGPGVVSARQLIARESSSPAGGRPSVGDDGIASRVSRPMLFR